ncbi:PA3496 family putative envelope integrity protein [Perlucidibaca piscinae]|uniref:PA3496 family putative envelope integrity protein n=1 Tax=Perlucidibaca piscinae TaxID=392589 RepID=UPI0003B700E7|nr:hypothetical protein [Perlucidibaca piscinae]
MLEEGFNDEAADGEDETVSKAQAAKNALLKRRALDDVIEEHRLNKRLRDYDFDLDDD